jgi:hypothetical protein
MNKKLKLFTQIIFYGSIWGLIEATLGHVLHFIPVTIAGSIMFPIAGLILYKAYKKTNSKAALFYIGFVAAAIKSIDFLLPQLSIFKTINPMLSIILESLVVVLVVTMITSKKPVNKYLALPIASISWRTLFIGWMALQFVLTGNLAPYIKSFSLGFEFVVISGLISGALASALLFIDSKVTFTFRRLDYSPYLATVLLVVALIATYTL